MTDWTDLPDLARRDLGGAVVWANDEAFAARQNLITPGPSVFDPTEFGANGKIYDGWETRRRRDGGHGRPGPDACDVAIVRLATPTVVRGIVVDTAWFRGNYPPTAAVDGLRLPDGSDPVTAEGWFPLVERSPLAGDTANAFDATAAGPVTHVRLRIFPDGGVARLRVHGEAAPDPAVLTALGTFDLAALELGGRVTDCSNRFYGSAANLLLPGTARSMGEGWETARRRDDGNDWVEIALATEGVLAVAELDTSWFLHNAPGAAQLSGHTGDGAWRPLLPRTPITPDTRHRFVLDGQEPVTHVRLDAFPDGGMARLRLHGRPTADGLKALASRWG